MSVVGSTDERAKHQFASHPLPGLLQAAVPLWIEGMRAADGGPPEDYRARIDRVQTVLSEVGEAVLFKTKPGESARAFNALAEGIAVLSFCPGGVECFGVRWDGRHRLGCARNVDVYTDPIPDLEKRFADAIDIFGRLRNGT